MSIISAETALKVGKYVLVWAAQEYATIKIDDYRNAKNSPPKGSQPPEMLSEAQQQALNKSCGEFKKLLEAEGTVNHVKVSVACPEDGVQYSGKVVKTTDNHIFHEIGANNYVVHDKNDLSRIPNEGEHAVIQYRNRENEQTTIEASQNLQSGISR